MISSNICWTPGTRFVEMPDPGRFTDPSQIENRVKAIVQKALDSIEESLSGLGQAFGVSDSAKFSGHLAELVDHCSVQSIYFRYPNYEAVAEAPMQAWSFEKWKPFIDSLGNFQLGNDLTLVDKQKEKIFDALLSFGICCYQAKLFPGFQNWLKGHADGTLYVGPESFAIAAQYGDEELLQLLWDKASSKTMPIVMEEAVYISSVYESRVNFILYKEHYEDNIATSKTSRLIQLGKGVISQEALLACLGKVCGQPRSLKENYSSMDALQKKEFHRSRKVIYSLINAIEKNDFQSIFDSWEKAWENFKTKEPSLLDRGTIFSKLISSRNRGSFLDELSKESFGSLYEKLGDLIQALQTCRFREKSLQEKFQSMEELDKLIKTLYQKDCDNLYLMLSQMKLQLHFGVPLSQLLTSAFREAEKNPTAERDHAMWVKLRGLILATPSQNPEPALNGSSSITESLEILAKARLLLSTPFQNGSQAFSSGTASQYRKKRKNASNEDVQEIAETHEDEAPPKTVRKRNKPNQKAAEPETLPIERVARRNSVSLSQANFLSSVRPKTCLPFAPIFAGSESASLKSSVSAPVATTASLSSDISEIARPFQTILTVEDGNCMVDAIALWLLRKGAQSVGECPEPVRAILPANGSANPENEMDKRKELRKVLREVGCEQIHSWEMNDAQTPAIIGAIQDALERDPKARQDTDMTRMGFLLKNFDLGACNDIFRGEIRATYVNYIKQDYCYLDGPFLLAMNELFQARVQVLARSQQSDGRWINHINLSAFSDGEDPITIFRVQKTKRYGGFVHTVEHYLGVNWTG